MSEKTGLNSSGDKCKVLVARHALLSKQAGKQVAGKHFSRKVSFGIADQKLTESRQWLAVVRKTNIPLSGSDSSAFCSAQRGNATASFDQWVFERVVDGRNRVQCPFLTKAVAFLPFFFNI